MTNPDLCMGQSLKPCDQASDDSDEEANINLPGDSDQAKLSMLPYDDDLETPTFHTVPNDPDHSLQQQYSTVHVQNTAAEDPEDILMDLECDVSIGNVQSSSYQRVSSHESKL